MPNAPCSKILFHDVEIRLRLIEGQYGERIFRKGQCRAPRCGVRPEFGSEQGRIEGELDQEHEGETSGGSLIRCSRVEGRVHTCG
jgi:hypothetical protein